MRAFKGQNRKLEHAYVTKFFYNFFAFSIEIRFDTGYLSIFYPSSFLFDVLFCTITSHEI